MIYEKFVVSDEIRKSQSKLPRDCCLFSCVDAFSEPIQLFDGSFDTIDYNFFEIDSVTTLLGKKCDKFS